MLVAIALTSSNTILSSQHRPFPHPISIPQRFQIGSETNILNGKSPAIGNAIIIILVEGIIAQIRNSAIQRELAVESIKAIFQGKEHLDADSSDRVLK